LEEAVLAGSLMPSELLCPSPLQGSDLDQLEHALRIRLPNAVRAFIMNYDLNEFEIGYISFGRAADNYIEFLIKSNTEEYAEQIGNAWWWPGERPPNRILVAYADAWAAILDTSNSEILAFLDGTHHTTAQVVARDLEHFIRGVATVRLDFADPGNDRDARVTALADEAGATPAGREFWQDYMFQQHGF